MLDLGKTLGLASLVVCMACGGSGGGGGGGGSTSGGGTCTTTSAGGMILTCTDYGDAFTASFVMQACTSSSATYSAAACPTANRVGRCEISKTSGGISVASTVSLYAPATSAEGMSVCNMENGVNGVTTTFVPN